MRKLAALVFFYSVSSAVFGDACFKSVNWTKCKKTDGIEICSARYGRSNIRAFQGIGQIDAPIESVVSAFMDTANYPKWQVDLKKVEIIRKITPVGNQACTIKNVEHSFGTKPWVFRWTFWVPNAEFVYNALYQLSKDGKAFTLDLKSDDNNNIPLTKGYQRGEMSTCYRLQSLSDKQTQITTELWVNLKNDIAPSKINASLSKWPVQLIESLNKYLSNPERQQPSQQTIQYFNDCIQSPQNN